MPFKDQLRARNPELFPEEAPVPAGIAPGAQQIMNTVNQFMPMIESITGLTRRDIFLALLKGGLKGGSIESIINSLMGKQPVADAKFVRYAKTFAIWLPVGIFLTGIAIVSVILFAKLVITITGVI